MDDRLYALTLLTTAPSVAARCVCFVFKPVPTAAQVTTRNLDVALSTVTMPASTVRWSEVPESKAGHPPEVAVPLGVDKIQLALVTSTDDASIIVGLEFSIQQRTAGVLKLRKPFHLGTSAVRDLRVTCQQISGHVSNDGKQVNILTGQASCSVGFPMPCCMISKYTLNDPPAWLWRMFLRHATTAALRDKAIA